jgi:hypothetical protein
LDRQFARRGAKWLDELSEKAKPESKPDGLNPSASGSRRDAKSSERSPDLVYGLKAPSTSWHYCGLFLHE